MFNFEDHLKSDHGNLRPSFNYWHTDAMPFLPNQTVETINMVDAFNKKFIFYYSSKAGSSNVSFMIFLLGRKLNAQKYLVDFELKKGVRKVKFVEHCFCDTDDIERLVDENRCISISKNTIKSFTVDGKFEFRFIIKRKDILEKEDSVKEMYLKQHILPDAGAQGDSSIKDLKNLKDLKEFKDFNDNFTKDFVNGLKPKWRTEPPKTASPASSPVADRLKIEPALSNGTPDTFKRALGFSHQSDEYHGHNPVNSLTYGGNRSRF